MSNINQILSRIVHMQSQIVQRLNKTPVLGGTAELPSSVVKLDQNGKIPTKYLSVVTSFNGKTGNITLDTNKLNKMQFKTLSNGNVALTQNTYYIGTNISNLNISTLSANAEAIYLDISTSTNGCDIGWYPEFSFNVQPNIQANKRYLITLINNVVASFWLISISQEAGYAKKRNTVRHGGRARFWFSSGAWAGFYYRAAQ